MAHSTPFKRSSVSHSSRQGSGSVTKSHSPLAMPPMTQDHLENVMKDEFARATWESIEILKELLPHDMKVVDAVCKELEKQQLSSAYFQPKPPRKLSSSTKSQQDPWPMEKGEPDYYGPVIRVLNATLKAALKRQKKLSYYSSLCFSVYDRPVVEGKDGSHPLKPDGLGCNGEISPTEKVSWRDIRIAVEVKGAWPELVAQAAAYSRCMFASSRGQNYNLVIGFNHKTCEVRFLFFHRGGVTACPAVLKSEVGWQRFVAAMVGLASVTDRD
jgi:hypothetical protein